MYLFSIDGKRQVNIHYPRKVKEDRAQSNKILIPNADSALIIEEEGLEYLMALYSEKPIENIAEMLNEIVSSPSPIKQAMFDKLKPMGFNPDAIAYAQNDMSVNLSKSKSPLIPIIIELPIAISDDNNKKDEDKKPETTPTLHVLSIGLNDAGYSAPLVEFAEKDVFDFMRTIKEVKTNGRYQNLALNSVVGDKLTYKNLTAAFANLNKSMVENDVALIFISAPIKKIEGKYYILPVDFDANNIDNTSLEYSKLLKILETTTHSKVIFLDGNHSEILNNSAENITIINSAQSGESVYEDAIWENSAFTVAMLEAFSNYQNLVDTDKDKTLSLGELYFYIKNRVADLTKTQYNDEQNPISSNNKMNTLKLIDL